MASSPVWFSIPEFYGIRQDKDSRLLPFGTAYEAVNIETGDGNLSVAKGFTKYFTGDGLDNDGKVPNGGNTSNKPRALVIAHTNSGVDKIYVVSVYRIYVWNPTTSRWDMLNRPDGTGFNFYSANPPLPGLTSIFQIDKLQTRIGSDDSILIGTGKHRIIKINIGNDTAEEFGSGAYYEMGTSSAYNSGTLTITMSAAMTDEAKRRALLYGVYLTNNYYYAEVDSIPNNTTIKLKSAPSGNPGSVFYVRTRGGSSDAKINFIETFANRLFAAGDPDNPCRLYWSCVPGDGRTYEDWFMVEGSEDASGGFVEVNAEDGDPIIGITALSNQLLIFKRHSVWRLYGDRPSTFTLERVEKNSDMMSNRGVIVRHDVPYFLMPDGMYTYDGVGIVPLDGGTSHLARFFRGQSELWTARPRIDYSTCALWNNRMYFSFRESDHSPIQESGLVVYDVARGTYMLRTGLWFVDLATSGPDILMLRDDGYVFKFESGNTYVNTDGNEAGIAAAWRTQWTDFGKKMNVHQVMAMYLQLLNDDVIIGVAGDYAGANDSKHVKATTERAGHTVARFQVDQSHYFRFGFSNQIGTRRSAFSVRGGVNIKVLSELKE